MKQLGFDPETGRSCFYLHLQNPRSLRAEHLPTSPWACLLAWDSADESVETISHVLDLVHDGGCVYFCAWGTGCGRVHDVFDEICVGDGSNPDRHTIMTTLHEHQSLDEALWFFLRSTWSDKGLPDPEVMLTLLVGDHPARGARIEQVLADPVAFAKFAAEQDL